MYKTSDYANILAVVAGEKLAAGEKQDGANNSDNVNTPSTDNKENQNTYGTGGEDPNSDGINNNTDETGVNLDQQKNGESDTENNVSSREVETPEENNNPVSPASNAETPHSKKQKAVIKLYFTEEELQSLNKKASANNLHRVEFIKKLINDWHGDDLVQYDHPVDDVTRKIAFLEEKLPLFEKVYLTTGKYVDKINLSFADLLKNLSYFEERKEKILRQTKDFKVYLTLKEGDKKALARSMEDILEEHKASFRGLIELGEESMKQEDEKRKQFLSSIDEREKTFSKNILSSVDNGLQSMQKVNSEIIQKIEINGSFLDNINRIKKEYLVAFFAFLVSGTILLTIIVEYILQMK